VAIDGPDEDIPSWQERVVDRQLKRAREAVRARAIGPTTRIVNAATELARETGGTSFTVQQVVDRAGVALQTFYRHFGSRDELMLAFLEEASRAEQARYAQMAEKVGDPISRIRVLVLTPLKVARQSTEGSLSTSISREMRVLRDVYPNEMAALGAPYTKLLEEAIVEAASAGLVEPEEPNLDAEIISELVSGAFAEALLGPGRSYSPHTEAYIWRFCLRALRATPTVLAEADASLRATKDAT
jgi:AcrR family transcriptional regulator